VSVFDGIERVGAVEEPERRGPVSSSELRRVLNLPRRVWQAAALREIYEQLGLFGPVGVGEGKTLITLLATCYQRCGSIGKFTQTCGCSDTKN
jgi:hypothetical protein